MTICRSQETGDQETWIKVKEIRLFDESGKEVDLLHRNDPGLALGDASVQLQRGGTMKIFLEDGKTLCLRVD